MKDDVCVNWKKLLSRILLYFVVVLICLFILYPYFVMFCTALKSREEIFSINGTVFPIKYMWSNFVDIWSRAPMAKYMLNSILIAGGSTVIAMLCGIPAAYALSRKDLWGRKALMGLFVFTMFFSGGLIPIFLTVQELGLYNSFWVMVVPFSVSAYNVIVARTFFETSLPPDLWDAAQIDGCGNLRFFFTIALPLSKAVISVIALWTAVGQWNSYFNALIYIRDENLYPLALIMRNILVTQQIQSALGTGEAALIALRKANLMRYAMIIVATVPIMCVYPFVQKYFDQGVMIGAVKG